jgi:hypothetical protein
MSPLNRKLCLKWSAIAAPVLMVAVFTAVNQFSGPRKAAAVTGPALDTTIISPRAASPQVVKVEEWIKERRERASSPFEASPTLELEGVAAEVGDSSRSYEGVRLTGVFRSNDVAIAAINGKLVREGQEVAPGITVTAIDARARRVTLSLSDGQEVVLTSGSSSRQQK